MVAVLFTIRARGGGEPAEPGADEIETLEPTTTAQKLQAALQNLPREALLTLLVELGAENSQYAHVLLARYGPPLQMKTEAVVAVRDALALGENRKGFVDYWVAAEAARAVDALSDQAARLVETGKAERAVPIYQAVLEEVLPAMEHADDSMGALGGTID